MVEALVVKYEDTEHFLELFLLQLLLILALARAMALCCAKLCSLPEVLGELAAGIVIGISFLGRLKDFSDYVFPSEASYTALYIVSEVALLLTMALIGEEIEVRTLKDTRMWAVALIGIVTAFLLSVGLAVFLYDWLDEKNSFVSYVVVVASANSFTALPVLKRFVAKLGGPESTFSQHMIGIASIDDILAWICAAIVFSISSADPPNPGLTVLYVLVFICACIATKQVLTHYYGRGDLGHFAWVLFFLVLTASWLFCLIGLHASLGAFLFGFLGTPRLSEPQYQRPREMLTFAIEACLLPVLFARAGFSYDLWKLADTRVLVALVVTNVFAVVFKTLPTAVIARFVLQEADLDTRAPSVLESALPAEPRPSSSPKKDGVPGVDINRFKIKPENKVNEQKLGEGPSGIQEEPKPATWRSVLRLAILLDARGLVTFVMLSIALDLLLINSDTYFVMLSMTIVTTALAWPVYVLLEKSIQRREQQEEAGDQQQRQQVPSPPAAAEEQEGISLKS